MKYSKLRTISTPLGAALCRPSFRLPNLGSIAVLKALVIIPMALSVRADTGGTAQADGTTGSGIGNLVYRDLDKDGQFDPGTEMGIDGVAVRLFKAGTTPKVDVLISVTVTENGGRYHFADLPRGRYIVNIYGKNFGAEGPLRNLYSTTETTGDGGGGVSCAAIALFDRSTDDSPHSADFGFAMAEKTLIPSGFSPLPKTLESLLIDKGDYKPNVLTKSHENSYSDQFPQEFRTIDGSGNNLGEPKWGAAGAPFQRLVPSSYSDGANHPSGESRPSARTLSNEICAQSDSKLNASKASDYLWQWGQFLDHDIDETPGADPEESFPIPVPRGDTAFDPFGTGVQEISLNRSAYIPDDSGVRQQVNLITSFIDGSNVYGSDEERAWALRTNDGTGRLRTSDSPHGPLLPYNDGGFPNAGGSGAALFLAGDVRANEQVALTSMHTLFVREHNHWAGVISAADPALSGDHIYELAKVIVAAELQVITYHEFLPVFLGKGAIPPYEGYKPSVDPRISNLFATAAYRVGHTMLSPKILRLDLDGESIPEGPIALKDGFFKPSEIRSLGIEPYLLGLAAQRAQAIDTRVVDDVRNFLFGPPGAGGFDLAALNIQRGRDHGLPGYSEIRSHYGLSPIVVFDDYPEVEPDLASRLESQYGSPDKMDTWIGLLGEQHVKGAMVGETAHAILVDQFTRLRDGDRFWYQNYLGESLQKLLESQKLSDVILRNTRITTIQEDVFRVNESDGPATPGSGKFASSWEEWQEGGWGATDVVGMEDDADSDGRTALMEYGLGQVDTSGFATDAGLSLEANGEQVDALLKIPANIGDLDFLLEVSGDRKVWRVAVDSGSISEFSDGYEIRRYADIASSVGSQLGYCRLRIEHRMTGTSVVGTDHAWYTHEIRKGFSTLGLCVLKSASFAGAITAVGSDYVEFAETDFTGKFEPGTQHFLEVTDGESEGHRYELDEERCVRSRIYIDLASANSVTGELYDIPAGSSAKLREHQTLEEVLPLELLLGGRSPETSDQVLFFENGVYHSYFFLDSGGAYHQWTSTSNALLEDKGSQPIYPGQGLFVKRAPGRPAVSKIITGQVRDCMFWQRLKAGYNLVAGGYPGATTPTQRQLRLDNGFLGGTDPSSVDQLQFWRGDVSDENVYDSYFLLDAGDTSEYRYWTSLSNALLDPVDNKPLFKTGRAAFIQLRQSDHPQYRWAAP